jgi:hypothetical protein
MNPSRHSWGGLDGGVKELGLVPDGSRRKTEFLHERAVKNRASGEELGTFVQQCFQVVSEVLMRNSNRRAIHSFWSRILLKFPTPKPPHGCSKLISAISFRNAHNLRSDSVVCFFADATLLLAGFWTIAFE